jgi:lysozyme
MRICNLQGERLIEHFEGCKLTAYQDVGGIWTIGYGHTGKEAYKGAFITQDEATHLLQSDLMDTEEHLDRVLPQNVRGNQFSALCCFVYNVGKRAFDNSTLFQLVRDGDFTNAAEEFLKWDHVNGKQVPGLLARRATERALFMQEEQP